MVILQYLLILA